jgi:flagellar motor switch/type III secretory pathway protein FliN
MHQGAEMRRDGLKRKQEKPKLFASLKRYSAAQVIENNHYRRLLAALPDCSSWVGEVLRELLPVSTGNELQITLTNELRSDETQTLVFTQKEISIGRATTSDIPLPLQSISRQHARIFERDESFYIEDLHSVSGTSINGRKLDAAHPCLLNAGDEVRMYPYVMRFAPKTMWTPDEAIRLTGASSPAYLSAEDFSSSFGPDVCQFEASLFPDTGNAVLAISRSLLKTILSRLLRNSKAAEMVDADATLVEFVAVCVLEQINRALQFPFEFSLRPLSGQTSQKESGLMLETAVELSGVHGHIRLFVPGSALEKTARERSSLPPFARNLLSWSLPLALGSVTLGAGEIQQVEPGDTLIYTPQCCLILPPAQRSAAPYRGWLVSRSEEEPASFVVHNFHEWGFQMPQEENLQEPNVAAGEVDLSTLPVNIHVVLTRVEMSLQELGTLAAGSIIQLDEETNSTVQLVSGNSGIGSGELVNLDDGRMGVKITHWREQ